MDKAMVGRCNMEPWCGDRPGKQEEEEESTSMPPGNWL